MFKLYFAKYHALGNDYLVLRPEEALPQLSPALIRRLCHRHFGVGADGVLIGPLPASAADVGLRLFNPDGSEFEKSGNGLRIFARYLWDYGLISPRTFTVHTLGGTVRVAVETNGWVTVDMGEVSFQSQRIPVVGPPREVLNEPLTLEGETVRFSAATVGNPHCVILRPQVSAEEAQRWGPLVERDPRFPRRTNVQFVEVVDRDRLRLEIWERGAGYTLASGSSACAAAAVAHRLGLVGRQVTVAMPGGALTVTVHPDWTVTQRGPATRVAEGWVHPEALV